MSKDLIGFALIDEDKSVCSTLHNLLETVVSAISSTIRQVIVFFVFTNSMVDLIPLAEVKSCTRYDPDARLGDNEAPEHAGLNALQIETNPDGYNSGMFTCKQHILHSS